jgi:hypothetical protein
VGGPLQGRKEVHLLRLQWDAMNTLIKIVKRDASTDAHDPEVSSVRTNGQRTAEKIVKSWIKEARERRRTAMSQLQDVIRKEIGGAARG